MPQSEGFLVKGSIGVLWSSEAHATKNAIHVSGVVVQEHVQPTCKSSKHAKVPIWCTMRDGKQRG